MTVSLNSWRGHTSEVWLSCLLLVRESSLNLKKNLIKTNFKWIHTKILNHIYSIHAILPEKQGEIKFLKMTDLQYKNCVTKQVLFLG